MPGMASGDEVVSPSTEHPSPIPGAAGGTTSARPTPADLLAWIAASGGQPWYPSRHAAATGANRDALDDPLNELRGGLVRVAEWERGAGQGYVLTPQGEAALAAGSAFPASVSRNDRHLPNHRRSRPRIFPLTSRPSSSRCCSRTWCGTRRPGDGRGLPAWPFFSGELRHSAPAKAVYGYDLPGRVVVIPRIVLCHGHAPHLLINLLRSSDRPTGGGLVGRWRLMVILSCPVWPGVAWRWPSRPSRCRPAHPVRSGAS